jgi:diguanylate cyclase (GGDEF)-like protein
MNVTRFLDNRGKTFWLLGGFGLVLLLGLVDFFTGYQVAFSLFYLIPIIAVTWYAGGRLGLLMSGTSAIAWFLADIFSGNINLHLSIYLWNTLIRTGFFLIINALLSTLKKAFVINRNLANTDYITGATSIRHFYELVQVELERSRRAKRPFTVAYMDLDDFKQVNDLYGHSAGDRALQLFTAVIRDNIRKIDIIARLGGDEFALFLSDLGEKEARTVIERIRQHVSAEMQKAGWPVTVSIGLVTCNQAPPNVDELIKLADAVMYTVKAGGKNNVSSSVFGG